MKKVLSAILIVLVATSTGADTPKAFYVAPEGVDTNAGTATAPFATLTRARDAIRALKAGEGVPEGGITVWLTDGAYGFTESLTLTEEDSGTAEAPITYRALHPGKARLFGGEVLAAEAFMPVSKQDMLERFPEEARAAVRVIDLKSLGINNYGVFPDAFRTIVALPELFFNDARMTLAQWPNEGWAEIESVIESGPAPWRKHESEALGVIKYSGDSPTRWTQPEQVWLEGYWCFDWASETIRVKAIDTETRQITLGTKHHYGIGSGNPAPRRYRAINVLEELDAPGEYFLDRVTGLLYFYPPADLVGARIVISLMTDPLIQVSNAMHIRFEGITLECTAGEGARIDEGEQVTFAGCTVRNIGLVGLVIKGGSQHTIQSCNIYDTGKGGIVAGGGDRKTLTPSGHRLLNNHIHHISQRMRCHAYNIHLNGVGVQVAHNLIEDAPHQAIGLAGNDHLLEYNEITRIAMASDDCGAFYMGRNPSERGTIIRYNYWHHIGSDFAHGSCAVYFDDGTGGQTVHGNVFYKASGGNFGAVFIHGGHDNVVTNNIFIDCSRAMGAAPWHAPRWKEWLDGDLWQKRLYEEVDIASPVYIERYPALKNYQNSHTLLRLNHARGNIAVKCGSLLNGNWDIQDCITVNYDPGFVDREAKNFQLRDDAPILKQLPGFEKLPLDKMGLYTDAYRTVLP